MDLVVVVGLGRTVVIIEGGVVLVAFVSACRLFLLLLAPLFDDLVGLGSLLLDELVFVQTLQIAQGDENFQPVVATLGDRRV